MQWVLGSKIALSMQRLYGLKGVAMETFTLDPRCWQIGRVFGLNPLLRRTDRIEALLMLFALGALLVAIPVAGVVGATVYGARDRLYTQEAHARHTVIAMVVDTNAALDQGSGTVLVQARWPVAAGERTGSFEHTKPVKAGERIQIWVDTDGNLAARPTPSSYAVSDAVAATMATLLIVSFAMAALVGAVRSRLGRAHDAAWEREIRCLQEDGGRTNRH
jgi:hypothetical protein